MHMGPSDQGLGHYLPTCTFFQDTQWKMSDLSVTFKQVGGKATVLIINKFKNKIHKNK